MDADEGPRPAEAVEEIGRHCLLGLFFFTRSLARAIGLVGCPFLSLQSRGVGSVMAEVSGGGRKAIAWLFLSGCFLPRTD